VIDSTLEKIYLLHALRLAPFSKTQSIGRSAGGERTSRRSGGLKQQLHGARAHIEPGREGLFNLVRSLPEKLRYENQLIVAEGDHVIAHGRSSGNGRPVAWIAADIVRIENGRLAEHWDVLQGEATKTDRRRPQRDKQQGSPTFVNLDKPYPNQPFTILIWGKNLPKFKKRSAEQTVSGARWSCY
jgi:hypothetical protein